MPKKGKHLKKVEASKYHSKNKPGQGNSMEPSKYRTISLINIGGKVLEKLLITRINHHMYRNEILINSQYGFTTEKSTIDAAMEVKNS